MPAESAFVTDVAPEARWDTTAELLASLVEIADRGQLWWLQSHTKKGAPLPDPVRIPRPGSSQPEPDGPRVAGKAEMVEFFAGHIRKG